MIGFRGSPDEIVSQSADWWRAHGLGDFAEGLEILPGRPESDERGGAFAFPAVQLQQGALERLLSLAHYEQPASVMSEMLDAACDRPKGPYTIELIEGIPDWSRGLTASGLRSALRERELSGLTVLEYLALQRRAWEVNGNHSFDDYVGTPPGWTWLSASTAGPLFGMAYYYPAAGRVEVSACKAGSKNPRKGSHAVTVLT